MIIHKRVKSMLPMTAGKDRSRLRLTRLYVSNEEAVATDGHVLVRTPVNNDVDMLAAIGEPATEPVLIDVDTIEAAIKNLPTKPELDCDNYVQITKDGDRLFVSSNIPLKTLRVKCEQEGGYPNYKAVIPDYTDNMPIKFALDGKLLKKICDMAIKHGDTSNRIIFEIPTTTEGRLKMQENDVDPVLDSEGFPVFELAPIGKLATALKFTIRDGDGQAVFTGIIMPLRIHD